MSERESLGVARKRIEEQRSRGAQCWGCAKYLRKGQGAILGRPGAPDEGTNPVGLYCNEGCVEASKLAWAQPKRESRGCAT